MAIKFHEPIGELIYGPLLVRVSLGVYFILSGMAKLDNHAAFITETQNLKMMPDKFATLYAIVLPYAEIGSGTLMVIGIWTTLAAILSAVILCSFMMTSGGVFPNGGRLYSKDLVLLCAACSLMYTGAGAFSVDRFRKT